MKMRMVMKKMMMMMRGKIAREVKRWNKNPNEENLN